MPVYAQIKDNVIVKFPYTLGDLIEENPFSKFPEDTDVALLFPDTVLALENGLELVEVEFQSEPQFDAKVEKIQRAAQPSLVNGKWIYPYQVVALTPEEQRVNIEAQSKLIRAQRDQHLKDSDFSQLTDSPVDKATWAVYRQNLRDLTKQPGFPWTITWPEQPK
jgi:hypothetical protein